MKSVFFVSFSLVLMYIIMYMTKLDFYYILYRLIYLYLALFICFHFKYESNNSLSPAIVGFLCFMFSSYITVGLIKDDYLLFAFSSYIFLIFIFIFIIIDKVASWWKFIIWRKSINTEYYLPETKKNRAFINYHENYLFNQIHKKNNNNPIIIISHFINYICVNSFNIKFRILCR